MIAVVVPVHNQAAYLGEALDSIARQTLQPAEVIVVDDGSTDGSHEVAERRGVRVLRTDRSGVGSARWTGVAAVSAPLVTFLDADDLFTEDHHRLLYEALDRKGADVACGMVREFADPSTDAASRYVIREEPRAAAVAGTSLLRRTTFLQAAEATVDGAHHDWFGLLTRLPPRVDVASVVLQRRVHGENRSIVGRELLHAQYLASARAAILRSREAAGE